MNVESQYQLYMVYHLTLIMSLSNLDIINHVIVKIGPILQP